MRVKHLVVAFPAAAAILAAGVGPARADSAPTPTQPPAAPTASASSQALRVAEAAGPLRSRACPEPVAGRPVVCVKPDRVTASTAKPRVQKFAAPAAGDTVAAEFPNVQQWCLDHYNDGTWVKRTEACNITGYTVTLTEVVDEAELVTGELTFDLLNYSVSSTTASTWVHQIGFKTLTSWGEAAKLSVSATPRSTGSCTTGYYWFETGMLTPGTVRTGRARFATTATAPSAIGYCTTTWDIVVRHPSGAELHDSPSMSSVRCDNATEGNSRVGCVMPTFAPELVYSQSSYPELAAHVAQAQASGLPGGSFARPLIRTTDATIANINRSLACGDAPSTAGMSCDEYPIARSYQGLYSGGHRRTWDGCGIPNVPQATGPTGVSVCMIPETQNNAQGGLNTQFFRQWRVLDGDRFRVTVGP